MSCQTTRASRVARLIALSGLVALAGCNAFSRTPNNPENVGWFCQSNESGEGWECVQDEDLARTPVPTRLPPDPEPPPADLAAPLDLDVPLSVELAQSVARAPDAGAPVTAAPVAGDPDAEAPAEPAALASAAVAAPVDPAATAPESATPQPAAAQSAAGGSNVRAADAVPRHVALAYVPAQPTAMLDLPPEYFAVQLIAMNSKQSIESFVHEHQLRGMSAARIEKDSALYFVLILGIYETYDRAFEASRDLPPPLDGVEPWIRSLGSLQNAMVRADQLVGNQVY